MTKTQDLHLVHLCGSSPGLVMGRLNCGFPGHVGASSTLKIYLVVLYLLLMEVVFTERIYVKYLRNYLKKGRGLFGLSRIDMKIAI